jgi:hypothetical protein
LDLLQLTFITLFGHPFRQLSILSHGDGRLPPAWVQWQHRNWIHETGTQMNLTLALRAVTLLAFVALSTALIVQPNMLGLAKTTNGPVLTPVVALSHF